MKIKSNLLPIASWWSDEAEDASESVLSVSWQIMSCIASHPAIISDSVLFAVDNVSDRESQKAV